MTHSEALAIFRTFLYYAFLLAMPSLVVSLVIGLIISIFQAATSIQEQTLAFLPRLVVVLILFVVSAPWMMRIAVYFTTQMFWKAAMVGH